MRVNSFDMIAGVYDALAHLVFGGAIRRAQLHFIRHLPQGGRVLVIGGGTGWLAEELLNSSSVIITSVESSPAMTARAEKRLARFPGRVEHICEPFEKVELNSQYDAVITNFFLDLFTESNLSLVIDRIVASLRPGAIWIITDFTKGRTWWQRAMLRLMYRFFKITARIQASHLPAWEWLAAKSGYSKRDEKMFYAGFIRTIIGRVTGAHPPAQGV